jgi:predicted phosphodiesterase
MNGRSATPALVLSGAGRVAFLGDSHGNLRYLVDTANLLKTMGVDVLVVLGDFGFLWPGRHPNPSELERLSVYLTGAQQQCFFVDGNHEDFEQLLAMPLDQSGVRPVAPGITHIPRGYRTTLAHGRTLAALGGANSVDRADRAPNENWWPEESISEADLERLGEDRADILIGHDAPLAVPRLNSILSKTRNRFWSAEDLAYERAGRQMFDRGFKQVRPSLYFGGHFHLHLDEELSFDGPDGPFDCRVILRERDGGPYYNTTAILDLETLEVEFPNPDFHLEDYEE